MDKRIRRALRRTPPIAIYRNFALLRSYRSFQPNPLESVRFLIFNRETDNFTYEIANTAELANIVAQAVCVSQ